MNTYTRLEASKIFGISNTIVRRNLDALKKLGFTGLTTDDNKLTQQAIDLIRLYRDKNQTELDRLLAEQDAPIAVEVELDDSQPIAANQVSTLATVSQSIAASIEPIALTSSRDHEIRAAQSQEALRQFIQRNNERSLALANNAATARRSMEQLGQEHAIGHLMTYANSLNSTLTNGLAMLQNGAVSTVDEMGKHAASVTE